MLKHYKAHFDLEQKKLPIYFFFMKFAHFEEGAV